ncbi:hypothetical protein ACEPAH_203 [Sanghuangporus vaninii]
MVNGHDQGSTAEQSSHGSSLRDVDDVLNDQTHSGPDRNRGKDNDEIHSELRYDLPPETESDINIMGISPNNALHLHLPSEGEVHVVDPPSATMRDSYIEHSVSRSPSRDPTQDPPPKPSFRVRFRSRVRIASGMHHHHHSPYSSQPRRNSTGSVDSESSPCSSISAPLRYTPDDSDSRATYPISALLKSRRQRPRPRRPLATGIVPPISPPRITRTRPKNSTDSGERAPLLRAPASRLGARSRRIHGDLNPEEEEETSSSSLPGRGSCPSPVREDVDVFGPWPWRLFNGYWWAWKCGSISGCGCPADGDDDESEDEQEQRAAADRR